ncbi:MAG: DNA repair protein RadC [Chloracidobacterium sp.]|nr:DNA repair protein RadC [Chloracidobacterium sp.]
MKYNDLPQSEQPAHRLRELGATALNTTELLSVALMLPDTDTASQLSQLVSEYDNLLVKIPRDRVKEINRVGDKTADMILAIAELARRQTFALPREKARINSPADAAALVQYDMQALDHEQLRVILLNRRNEVMKIIMVYKGSVCSSQVRVGELFKDALREQASAMIICHNHPSGDPTPSPDDVAVTRAIVQAGKLMDVDILDHIVIGQSKWASLKEKGLGFS